MSASTRRIPSYRHHKPSNQAFVELSGKRHYLGRYGSPESRERYKRMLAEWQSNGRQGPAAADISIVELVNRWRKHAVTYYVSPATGELTSSMHAFAGAFKPLIDIYGNDDAVRFGPLALQTVRDAMIDARLSRSTINKNIALIRQLFRWAVAQQIIPSTVLHALQAVPGLRRGRSAARETSPVLPVPDSVVDATLPHLPPAVRVMVQVARLTGMRPAEICIMRPCDIDMSGGGDWVYAPSFHKTEHHGKTRRVLIGPRAVDLIRPMLPTATDAFIFSPRRSEVERRAMVHAARKTPLSCGNTIGTNRRRRPLVLPRERYDTASFRHAVVRACDRAFPPPADLIDPADVRRWRNEHRWHPNQLRHAFATRVRRESGIDLAQTLLGHSKLDTTAVYAEANESRAFDLIRKIG